MRNLLLDIKIKRELKRFKNFKKHYDFNMLNITEKEDGTLFVGDVCIRNGKDGEWIGETDEFVNVGYKFHGQMPKALSNLFHYKFYFRGFLVESIESLFQGIKFKNKKTQKLVFEYCDIDSNCVKACADCNWKKDGYLYFKGKAIKRDSIEYENFVDEMYVSLLQNPLYVNALKNVGDKYILHAMGVEQKCDTVFTRFEFERELNCLKEYAKLYKK